jgi:hypothetical protein
VPEHAGATADELLARLIAIEAHLAHLARLATDGVERS